MIQLVSVELEARVDLKLVKKKVVHGTGVLQASELEWLSWEWELVHAVYITITLPW